MSVLMRVLADLTASRFAQRLLQKNVQIAQELMGIGSGAGVSASGETVILEHLKKRSKGPYRIFDVGSNRGQFLTMALAQMQGQDVEVHCFEPGKQTFEHLAKTAAGKAKVHLNNIGLGAEKSEAVLHYDHAGSEIASLTKRNLDHFGMNYEGSETVVIDTVDNYCAAKGIDRIDLLKVDIEGHELDCFKGAKGMFAKKAIGMITLEFGGANIDTHTYFRDFWYFFEPLGMDLYRITPSGYLFRLEHYYETHEQFRTTNFLAVLR
ncbi:MAG: FkbM family methyltransferase [Flavobacteriales bacterium]|nr:FkbM family methyltransferase [Flavobacteriales bacterium]